MEKEKIIKTLNDKAREAARSEKKLRQMLFFCIAFFIFMIVWFFTPADSLSESARGLMALVATLFLVFAVLTITFLPIGKISKEKVEKYFKEKLSQRIDDSTEELARVRERKSELEKELTILKEIQNEK